MDTASKIIELEARVKSAEQAKTVAETKLASAKEQLKEIEKQMTELGVTPLTIEAKIEELETQIAADLATVEKLLPEV